MLIDLAEHQNAGYISLKEIAARQNISKKYLEQIVPLFHNSGMLKANRGPKGGYMLAMLPEKYTVGDILQLTEGSLSLAPDADPDPTDCGQDTDLAMLPIWQGLSRVIKEYLDGITLQDILDQLQDHYMNNYMI